MEATLTYKTTCDARTVLEAAYEPASKVSKVELETTPTEIRGVKKKRKDTKTVFVISATDGKVTLSAPGLDQYNLRSLLDKVIKAIQPLIDDQGLSAAVKKIPHVVAAEFQRDRVLNAIGPTETIRFVSQGEESGKKSLIVVTDEFVRLVRSTGIFARGAKDVRISEISSVDYHGGIIREKLTIASPGVEMDIRKIFPGTGEEIAAGIRELMERSRSAAGQSAPAAPTAGTSEELSKIADLHASGVLTDDEFAAAKARILGI